MTAKYFSDDIPSNPNEYFKGHNVLVFDLISMQDATEWCHHPELVTKPLSLEFSLPYPLEQVTGLDLMGQ